MEMLTILDLFEKAVHAHAEQPLFWQWQQGVYSPISYQQVSEQVHQQANGWQHFGLEAGQKVALWLESAPIWAITELSIWYAGGVVVPINLKISTDTLLWQIHHAECSHLIIERHQLPLILAHKSALPEGLTIWINEETEKNEHENIHSLNELVHFGRQVPMMPTQKIANLIFTSGTMSDPRAVILTHHNIRTNIIQIQQTIPIPTRARTFMLLPMDHAFAHTVGLYCVIAQGGSIGFPPTGKSMMEILRMIPEILQSFEPDFLLMVPALIKSLKAYIERGVRAMGEEFEQEYRKALTLAYRKNRMGNKFGFRHKVRAMMLKHAVLRKIKEKLFPNMKFMVSGGAHLNPNVISYFSAFGLPVYQGYGLTEAAPVVATNNRDHHKIGSVGRPLPNIRLMITNEAGEELPADQMGEILVNGENVTEGYFNNPKATADTIQGKWLHTGDLGKIDQEGYLHVMGRFKSLLISADGEKYPPEIIETELEEKCPYIDSVCIYNNQSRFTLALIVPNMRQIQAALKAIPKNQHTTTALRLIEDELKQFRKESPIAAKWTPVRFRILDEAFSLQNGELNHNFKMVRPKIHQHYERDIETIYRKNWQNLDDPNNLEKMTLLLK